MSVSRLERLLPPLALVLLVGLVALTWHAGQRLLIGLQPTEFERPPSAPDGMIEGFTWTQSQADGSIFRLTGAQLNGFDEPEQIQVQQPIGWHLSKDGTQTHTQAQQGVLLENRSRLELSGDVIWVREAPQRPALRIESQQLTVWPDQGRTQSDTAVTILREGNRLEGTGMTYDQNTGVLRLQSRTRVFIDPAS